MCGLVLPVCKRRLRCSFRARFESARNTTGGTVSLLRAISKTLPDFTTKRLLPGGACAETGQRN